MQQLQKLRAFLAGKKTYIFGALMLLTSLEKYISGETTLSQFITTVQGLYGGVGALAMSLRAAIAKK